MKTTKMKGGLTATNLAKHNKYGGTDAKKKGDGDNDSHASSDASEIDTYKQRVAENLKKVEKNLDQVKTYLDQSKKIIEDNGIGCGEQEGGFLLKGLTNATKLVKKVGSTAVRATKTVAKGAMRGTRKVAKGAMRGTKKVAKGAMRGTRKVAKTLKLRGGKKQPSIKH
jgi:hypothetical protein